MRAGVVPLDNVLKLIHGDVECKGILFFALAACEAIERQLEDNRLVGVSVARDDEGVVFRRQMQGQNRPGRRKKGGDGLFRQDGLGSFEAVPVAGLEQVLVDVFRSRDRREVERRPSHVVAADRSVESLLDSFGHFAPKADSDSQVCEKA